MIDAEHRRFLWLAVGVALLLVANGRWILPLATWLFAGAWLVFLDRSRRGSGLAIAFVAYLLVHFVIWRTIMPVPDPLYFLIAAIYAAVYFLPFVAHRLLASKSAGLAATLVFPLAWVSVELLFSRWGTPYGSWASLAYTQSDQLAVLQLASLTGTAGITFLLTWCGATVAWMARPGQGGERRGVAVAVYGVALVAVLGFGQLRLAADDARPVARTAALVPSASAVRELEKALGPVRRGEEPSAAQRKEIENAAQRLNDDLLQRTRREARAGAALVSWTETAGRLVDRDEEDLLARAGRLAAEEEVVLLLGLGIWHPGGSPPFDNKIVAVDSGGGVAWHYRKAHPIIGAESPFVAAGDGLVPSLDAHLGRLGGVICHDLDFPQLLRQAGSKGIGLLVAPSDDWAEIATLHARMAVFRAVENGFTLLRPTRGGRSIAVDPWGRLLARLDFADDAFVAHVPVGRIGTAYGVVGDLFSWLCLAGLLTCAAIRRGRPATSP